MATPHGGDCDGTWCPFCGCCEHGEATDGIGCRAADAPDGMQCPESGCGCEGTMGHLKPTMPPEATTTPDSADPVRQLHQELSLFSIGDGA
jgi:hypothetical protein